MSPSPEKEQTVEELIAERNLATPDGPASPVLGDEERERVCRLAAEQLREWADESDETFAYYARGFADDFDRKGTTL